MLMIRLAFLLAFVGLEFLFVCLAAWLPACLTDSLFGVLNKKSSDLASRSFSCLFSNNCQHVPYQRQSTQTLSAGLEAGQGSLQDANVFTLMHSA